jgi:hypothetical protein
MSNGMENLFGAEFDAPPESPCVENQCAENSCATPTQGKGKKKSSKDVASGKTSTVERLTDDTVLDVRQFRVKIYNEVYDYAAPEDQEKVTIGDIRQWLVTQGYSELTKERATFVWAKPEEGEKFLVAGVKFEKMG